MRPSKYKADIPQKVIDYMREGMSIEEVCYELNICKQTFYNWCDKYDELLDAKKKGIDFACGWWMKQGRESLRDKEFSATLFYMNMKNRFNWKDRQDVTSDNEKITPVIEVNNDRTKANLEKLMND